MISVDLFKANEDNAFEYYRASIALMYLISYMKHKLAKKIAKLIFFMRTCPIVPIVRVK